MGSKEKQNNEILKKFLGQNNIEIQQTTEETAEIFAEIKSHLKNMGRPIPINDVWIAAQAIESGAILLTNDKHFKNIPGLRIWPN